MAKDTLERTETRLGPHEVLVSGQIVVLKRKSTAALMFALLSACFAFKLNASMLSPVLKGMETAAYQALRRPDTARRAATRTARGQRPT